MLLESDIFEHIKNNKARAIKMLFEKYSDFCYVICMRYLNNKEVAEEMVMNGFVKAYQHMERFEFKGEGSLKAWLKRIVINECLMNLRSQKTFKEAWVDDQPEFDGAVYDIQKMEYRDILKMINELPVTMKTVFNLYEIEGYSHAEISEMLGVSVGASKSGLSRAKSALREKLIMNGY